MRLRKNRRGDWEPSVNELDRLTRAEFRRMREEIRSLRQNIYDLRLDRMPSGSCER